MTEQQEKNWVAKGFDVSTLSHRKLLVEKVAKCAPFKSLLDIGCATGPDLVLYEAEFPEAYLDGFDMTDEDVQIAKKLTKAKVYHADLCQELKRLPGNSFDIVVSNGVLMYVDPEYISEMIRIARKSVILSEKDPYKNNSISKYLDSRGIHYATTKIDAHIRPSWAENGYIYEIVK